MSDGIETLLTSKEASRVLKIHPKVLERMAKRGEVPALKVGKFWRYRATTLRVPNEGALSPGPRSTLPARRARSSRCSRRNMRRSRDARKSGVSRREPSLGAPVIDCAPQERRTRLLSHQHQQGQQQDRDQHHRTSNRVSTHIFLPYPSRITSSAVSVSRAWPEPFARRRLIPSWREVLQQFLRSLVEPFLVFLLLFAGFHRMLGSTYPNKLLCCRVIHAQDESPDVDG